MHFSTDSAHKIIAILEEFVYQNKAKNVDVLAKMREMQAKCWISFTIAGRLTPM